MKTEVQVGDTFELLETCWLGRKGKRGVCTQVYEEVEEDGDPLRFSCVFGKGNNRTEWHHFDLDSIGVMIGPTVEKSTWHNLFELQ